MGAGYGCAYTDMIDFSKYKSINVVVDRNNNLQRLFVGINLNDTNHETMYKFFDESIVTELGDNKYLLSLDLSNLTEEQKNAQFGLSCFGGNGTRTVYEIYLER